MPDKSALICVGSCARSSCGTAASCHEVGPVSGRSMSAKLREEDIDVLGTACGSATFRGFARPRIFTTKAGHHCFPQSITCMTASMLH